MSDSPDDVLGTSLLFDVFALNQSVGRLLDEGRLTELSDVGPSIASVIDEVARTGRSTLLETLRRGRSPGLLGLLDVPGLSPRRIEYYSNYRYYRSYKKYYGSQS